MPKVEIEVNGKRYLVACAPGQEDRLVAFGDQLDARIRQIANATGDLGEARLLLIAALSLLDELDVLKTRQTSIVTDDSSAIAALVDAAARIDAIASRLGDATASPY